MTGQNRQRELEDNEIIQEKVNNENNCNDI